MPKLQRGGANLSWKKHTRRNRKVERAGATMNAIYIAQCPFCGCVESHVSFVDYGMGTYHYIVCDDPECGAEGPLSLTKEGAIEKWNQRNVDSYYDEETDRLTP